MKPYFVHFNLKADFLKVANYATEYNKSIVFLKDTQEIWTHGTFYAIPDTYKDKITNLETAVAALQAAEDYSFRKVSDGTTTFQTSNGKETLVIKGGDNTKVEVNPVTGEVTVGSTIDTTTFYPNASGDALAGRVDTLEADAIKTINGSDAVKVEGTGTSRTVSLTLNNEGKNVTLTQTANGLSAEVTNVDALVPVDGVVAGDKVLTLDGKKVKSTIALSVDASAGSDGKKYIRLTGVDGADLGKIDTADFVKDGMLDTVELEGDELVFTFNTASGKEAINVDLKKYIDAYDGSNLKLKSVAIPTTASEPTATDSVDSAIANLIARDRELKAEIDKINTDISDVQSGGLVGIDKGTDGDFVTTTVTAKSANRQSVGVAVTTQAVADATEANNGLATALDVKSYISSMLTWEEL